MNVHDLSKEEQYIAHIKGQQERTRQANLRKAQKPNDIKKRNQAGAMIDEFEMCRMKTRMQKMMYKAQMKSTWMPEPYYPTTKSIEELKPIYGDDVRLEIHHRGAYIIVRTITEKNIMTAVMAVVEDEHDNVMLLSLYQPDTAAVKFGIPVLNLGDVLLIKEPYFKQTSGGQCSIRVDHVTDIQQLDPDHTLLPTKWKPRISTAVYSAEEWKEEGNRAIRSNRIQEAIQRHTMALRHSEDPEISQTIRVKRALAYFRREEYDAALADTGYLKHPT